MTKEITTSSLKSLEIEDLELISKAKDDIKEILINHLGAACYEVAQYILDNFFEGSIESFRDKKTVANHKSLLRLIFEISNETGKSKSWIYDSINLWQDREKLQDCESYMKISISHRTLLLKVKKIEEKRQIADLIVSGNLSYRDTKIELDKLLIGDSACSSVLKLVSDPKEFKEAEYQQKISKAQLKQFFSEMNEQEKKKITKKTSTQIKYISKQIDDYNKQLKNIELFKKNWDSLS